MKQPVKEKLFNIIKIVIAILLALTMLASVAATMVRAAESKTAKELTSIFTHDLHSHIDTAEKGGFARIMTTVSQIKTEDSDVLVVDAGDFFIRYFSA